VKFQRFIQNDYTVVVLAETEVKKERIQSMLNEMHIPTFIDDEMKVEVTCTSIGTKSFTLAYAAKDAKSNLKANGESVVVCFDYTLQQTIEIPEIMRQGLELHLTA
jgi:acyl-CoA thioesterase FadM